MSFYLRNISHIIKQLKPASFHCVNQRFFITISRSSSQPRHWNQHELTNALCDFKLLQQRWFFSSKPLQELVTVNCPAFADSISEGDVKWDKVVGDVVSTDEIVAEIETDKTTLPIPSPVAGVIEALLVEDGTTVTPGTSLFQINTKGEISDKTDDESEEMREDTEAASAPIHTKIEEKSDFEVNSAKINPVSEDFAVDTLSRPEHRVKMSRMRLRISQRLKNSENTTAMLTTFNEVDMSNIMEMRSKYKESFLKKHGVKLSFMSAFIKASAYALQDQPVINAVIDDSSHEVVYRDFVDISIAVSTEKGLVVPVIRNCEKMNYLDIEKDMNILATKARNNDLTIEEMDGGTFTISNGGAFGSVFSTPIINLPQSAILGMHGIFDRPVAVNGGVKIRPMMYIALTYDHRLIDGREAVTFLKKIKEAVEDPRIMFLKL